MTLRERIADWISGGKLSARNRSLMKAIDALENEIKRHAQETGFSRSANGRCLEKDRTLRAIIERGNTKAPNSTVRDMVRIAQEGLGQ